MSGSNANSWIDVSRPLDALLGHWPADTPYEFRMAATIAAGSSVNVGAVTLSTHFGTHVDAPAHFIDGGATVDALPLEIYMGPALVIDARARSLITIADFNGCDLRAFPRALVKTGVWPKQGAFPSSIPVIDPLVPQFLGESGVLLFGIDLPSVDALDSKDLPNHHGLRRAGVHILESLCLEDAPAGPYELYAAPLSIAGGDAAPTRAVLRAL